MQKLTISLEVHCEHHFAEHFTHSEETEEPGVGKSSQVLLLREMLWVCGCLVSTGGILREGFPT